MALADVVVVEAGVFDAPMADLLVLFPAAVLTRAVAFMVYHIRERAVERTVPVFHVVVVIRASTPGVLVWIRLLLDGTDAVRITLVFLRLVWAKRTQVRSSRTCRALVITW